MRNRLAFVIPVVGVIVVLFSCGKNAPSARARVLDFVRTIQADSLADIMPYIDVDSVATYEYKDAQYDSLTMDQKKRRLLAGFVGNGEYRGVWAKSQIVVNNEFYSDDTTARVEVSFIDRSTRIQYYSQMGMKLRSNLWVITNFKVNQDQN